MTASSQQEPKWAPRRWILQRYGIPIRAFEAAVGAGYIRSAKWGASKQARRVFYVSDVERLLLAVAAGRTPVRVSGRMR